MTKLPTALSSVKTDITAATLFSLTFSQHCDGIWPLQFSEKSMKGIKNKFKLCHIAHKHYIFNIVWYILHKNQFVWIQFFRHFSRHHAWQTSHHSFQSTTSMPQDRSVYSLTNTYLYFYKMFWFYVQLSEFHLTFQGTRGRGPFCSIPYVSSITF